MKFEEKQNIYIASDFYPTRYLLITKGTMIEEKPGTNHLNQVINQVIKVTSLVIESRAILVHS